MSDLNKVIEQAKENYIASGGSACPICGTNDIEAGGFDFDGSSCWQNVKCNGCGKERTDTYTLTGIDFLEE